MDLDTGAVVESPPKRKPGRPRKAVAPVLQTQAPLEPMLVTYSLKDERETRSFRCSTRSQDGPFLVFVSRDGWQEKLSYVAISEIATLEVLGPKELIGSPVGLAPSRVNAAVGIPPANAPMAVPEVEPIPQGVPPGAYSAQQVWKEQQAKALLLKSDQASLRSTVIGHDGGLEVGNVAWLDGAPAE